MTNKGAVATVVVPVLVCLLALAGMHRSLSANSSSEQAGNAALKSAIQELHKQDVAATLSGDPEALANLFTVDGVLLEPGSAPIVGRDAILAENRKEKAQNPLAKELAYSPDIRDLQIMDGWAFEWGYFDATFRETPNSEAKRFQGKMLRVLKQQSDGQWKFARVMWNPA